MRTRFAVAGSALLLAAGCGGQESPDAPAPAATPAAADARLGEDAWFALHDEFVVCVQKEDSLGMNVQYRDGQAVLGHRFRAAGGKIKDKLSAPETIGRIVESEQAHYMGLRREMIGDVGKANLDVLIFRSAEEAKAGAAELAAEAGRSVEPEGLFVIVPLGPRDATPPELTACRERADTAVAG